MAKVKHISYTAEELEKILNKSDSIVIKHQHTTINNKSRDKIARQIKIDGQTYNLGESYNIPIAHDSYGLVYGDALPLISEQDANVTMSPIYVDVDGRMYTLSIGTGSEVLIDSKHTGTLDEIIHFFKEDEIYY